MMRQYGELKRRFPDYLLLFRLGDFYELFFDDAHTASRLLQLTLTSRQKGEGAIPMAGIPHHAADGYIARLIRAGQKVAVCEQMEEPSKARQIVRRDVVRVITPGTITDTQFLDGARNNFLLAAHATASAAGVALIDVSTGDFWVGEEPGAGDKKDREDGTQVHLLSLDGGEARRLTDLPRGVTGFEWSPDGSRLVVLSTSYRADRKDDRKARGLRFAGAPLQFTGGRDIAVEQIEIGELARQ